MQISWIRCDTFVISILLLVANVLKATGTVMRLLQLTLFSHHLQILLQSAIQPQIKYQQIACRIVHWHVQIITITSRALLLYAHLVASKDELSFVPYSGYIFQKGTNSQTNLFSFTVNVFIKHCSVFCRRELIWNSIHLPSLGWDFWIRLESLC